MKLEDQEKRRSFQNKKDGRLGDRMIRDDAETETGHEIYNNKSLSREQVYKKGG